MGGWWGGIGAWFAFVNRRRIDPRFPVWPLPQLAVILGFAGAAILVTVAAVDPIFLGLVNDGVSADQAFFQMITDIGKSDWVLVLTGVLIFAFTLLTADRFRGEALRVWHRALLTLYYVFTTVAFSGLLANLIKLLVGRARPPLAGDEVWRAMPLIRDYDFASFPSGHATTAGALSIALALLFPRWRCPILTIGVLVAVSRSFVGVHFPSDVIAGFTLGALFSWIYARGFARKRLLFHFTDSGELGIRGEWRPSLDRLGKATGTAIRARRRARGRIE